MWSSRIVPIEFLGVSSRRLPLSSSSGIVEIVPAWVDDPESPGGADVDGDDMDMTLECIRGPKRSERGEGSFRSRGGSSVGRVVVKSNTFRSPDEAKITPATTVAAQGTQRLLNALQRTIAIGRT